MNTSTSMQQEDLRKEAKEKFVPAFSPAERTYLLQQLARRRAKDAPRHGVSPETSIRLAAA